MLNLSERVRVRVSHRVPVVAAGVVAALIRRSDFEVRLDDGERGPADVVVADYATALQLMNDRAATGGDQRQQRARVLIVADSNRESEVRAALQAGVHGYILLSCRLEELTASVIALSRGARYLCTSVASRMAESMAHDSLTHRESEVLLLMVKGYSNKVIARALDIAPGTVKAHAKAVFGKLQVCTRLQAVAIAAERGLVSGLSDGISHEPNQPRVTNTMASAATPALSKTSEVNAAGGRPVDAFAQSLAVIGADRRAANS